MNVLEDVAKRYDELADELEVAAAQARRTAGHFRDGSLARGPAQAFSVQGHLVRAQRLIEELAVLQADRTAP